MLNTAFELSGHNRKIIDAVISKAEKVCPDSLALIGVYGSAATGDVHPRSDLDLLILINDDNGWQLSDAFILDDIEVGYDIYCTNWDSLRYDAQCEHAQLSKLMDSVIVYIRDMSAPEKLEALRREAAELLLSDERLDKAQKAFDNAKKHLADCFMTDSLADIRMNAGGTIQYIFDAVMLYHGKYFRRGVKRTFEELSALGLPFDAKEMVLSVITAQTAEDIRIHLTELMKAVQKLLSGNTEKEQPSAENLSGTYEEMFSNWRSKMVEAAERDDIFSSFINMISCRYMLCDIASDTAIDCPALTENFNPQSTADNLAVFNAALSQYEEEYRRAGISPRRFGSIDDFVCEYLRIE